MHVSGASGASSVKNIRKLLVIVSPDVRDDPVLARARRLAQTFQPEIELVIREAAAEQALEHFSDLDVPVHSRIVKRRPDHEFIMKRIRAFQPDVALKSIRRRHPLARLLASSTDWKLVQLSPVPLWLVKSRDWHENGSIMAAVDPMHSKTQQNELDHLLLETTAALAAHLDLQSRVFHSYFPDVRTLFPKVLDAGDYLRQKRAQHQKKLEPLLHCHHMDMNNVVMARGDLARTLARAIKREHTNLLVLGALSRNVVERAIIGSTTERMLNDSRCDVLVMKSTGQQRTQ